MPTQEGTGMGPAAATPEDDAQLAALAELDKLGPADATPAEDAPPVKGRRRRSGTSGAERARRAKEAAGATSSTPAKPRAARTRAAKAPSIAEGMAGLYAMAGMGACFVPSPIATHGPNAGRATLGMVTGQTLMAQAGDLGAMWEEVAKHDPRIRDGLEKLLAGSTVGTIIAAHVPLALIVLNAAGKVPDEAIAQLVMLGMKVPVPAPAEAPAA